MRSKEHYVLFCEQVENENDVSKIRKFLSKSHTQADIMVDDMGKKIETMTVWTGLIQSLHNFQVDHAPGTG